MVPTRRKRACGESHRRHGVLTCHIEALRCVLRSLDGFVQNCVPTLAPVVFARYFDNNSATGRAVKLRSTNVVESQIFHVSESQRQLALDPISVPNSVVPTSVPNSLTIRHVVLDPIVVPNSVVPTSVTIRQLNFVTIRHLVLHPTFVPIVPLVVPILVSFIWFILPPNIEMLPPCVELDCC